MVWWQSFHLPVKEAEIVFTPSNHWSGRWGIDKNWSLWGSFAIKGTINLTIVFKA
jgi:L-ascorbate metabolism protein UlaG (beta-lactamase superfamily)